jgi:hypothetical protein
LKAENNNKWTCGMDKRKMESKLPRKPNNPTTANRTPSTILKLYLT